MDMASESCVPPLQARSQTSYQLFAKELYANKQVSGLTVAEASKKISAAWKALNVSEKSKCARRLSQAGSSTAPGSRLSGRGGCRFADKAASLKAEHEQTYGKPQKKAKAASGKKPNAFATFVKENFQDHKGPGDSAPAVMKRLSAKWKQLSAVEKTRYNPQPQH